MARGSEYIVKAVLDNKIIEACRNYKKQVKKKNCPGNFIIPGKLNFSGEDFEEKNEKDIDKYKIVRMYRVQSKIKYTRRNNLKSLADDKKQKKKRDGLPVEKIKEKREKQGVKKH